MSALVENLCQPTDKNLGRKSDLTNKFLGYRGVNRSNRTIGIERMRKTKWQRCGTLTDGVLTSYLYDGDNVIADLDASGVLKRSYCTPGLDSNVSTTSHGTETVTCYYNADGRWSVVNLTDSTGVVVNDYAYSAYGDKVDSLTGGDVEQRYTYTGRELSEVTGDFYFRYRWYGSGVGGFYSRDPLGYVDGMSVYNGYFASWIGIDPLGQSSAKDNCTKHGGKWSQKNSNCCCAGTIFSPSDSGNTCCIDGKLVSKYPGALEPRERKDCCNHFESKGLEKGILGQIICCRGQLVACTFRDNIRPSLGALPTEAVDGIELCIKFHEAQHFKDLYGKIKCDGCLYAAKYTSDLQEHQSECNASRVEMNCIRKVITNMKKLGKTGGTIISDLEEAYNNAKGEAEYHCFQKGVQ